MNEHYYAKLKKAFVETNSNTHQELLKLCTTSHWNRMLGKPKAFDCKIKRNQYIADVLDVSGMKVLDFGSGMGFLATQLALEGAREVVGVELLKEHREVSNYLVKKIMEIDNVKFIQNTENLNKEEFDCILLINAISHVEFPIDTLAKLICLLKTGGTLLIDDNNNLASFLIRRRNVKKWERTDKDYINKRLNYIKNKYKDFLSDASIESAAMLTYGFSFKEIDYWLKPLLENEETKKLLNLRNRAPFNPETNIFHENSFYPKELETILFNMGMAVRSVRAKYVFSFRENKLISLLFKHFPRLSLLVSPAFEIFAIKRKSI